MVDSFTSSFREQTLWEGHLESKVKSHLEIRFISLSLALNPEMCWAPRTHLDAIHVEPVKLNLTAGLILTLFLQRFPT